MPLGFIGNLLGMRDPRAREVGPPNLDPGRQAIQQQAAAAGSQARGFAMGQGAAQGASPLARRQAIMSGTQGTIAANQQAAQQIGQLEQQGIMARQQAQMQAQQINEDVRNRNAAAMGRITGTAIGVGGAAMLSDVHAKRDIVPIDGSMEPSPRELAYADLGVDDVNAMLRARRGDVGDGMPRDADSMALRDLAATQRSSPLMRDARALDDLQAYQFRYRPEAAAEMGTDTGPRIGVMAQDMERSPLYHRAVVDTPGGKAIDTTEAVPAMLAGQAMQQDRIDRMEEMLGQPAPIIRRNPFAASARRRLDADLEPDWEM